MKSLSLFLCILAANLMAQESTQSITKKAGLPVSLTINVTDKKGKPVSGIDRQAFSVTIGSNAPVTPDDIQPAAESPILFALVIDESGSSRDKVPFEKKYALQLFDALTSPANHGYLILFNDKVGASHRFVTRDELDNILSNVHPMGGTALYDAIWRAAQLLEEPVVPSNSGILSRRMIFVISDGETGNNQVTQRQAVDKAEEAGARIFGVGLINPLQPHGKGMTDGKQTLGEISSATGGKAIIMNSPRDISRDLSNILRSEYTITFTPKSTQPGSIQPIKIESNDPRRLKVSFPSGYLLK